VRAGSWADPKLGAQGLQVRLHLGHRRLHVRQQGHQVRVQNQTSWLGPSSDQGGSLVPRAGGQRLLISHRGFVMLTPQSDDRHNLTMPEATCADEQKEG